MIGWLQVAISWERVAIFQKLALLTIAERLVPAQAPMYTRPDMRAQALHALAARKLSDGFAHHVYVSAHNVGGAALLACLEEEASSWRHTLRGGRAASQL
eukprot:2588318-Prymnesium_polylepis.1